jgi:peptidoglycan/LPS O-acetylase OafA/YrhL
MHIQSLDGLRGIAILLVVFYHYLPRSAGNPVSAIAGLGWSGVDLFFVLSGFLITGILFDTRTALSRFSTFYARRALRLLPLYCLAVVVVLVGTHFLRGFRSWLDVPLFFYGANIVIAMPGANAVFPPYFDIRHFWSLALEEQFYSIWPLIVFLVPRRETLIKICLGGIALALLLRITLAAFGVSTWVLNTQLPTRMDSLLVGALIALGVRGPHPEKWLDRVVLWRIALATALGIGAVIAVAKTLFWMSVPMSTLGYTLLASFYASLLALALIPGTVASRIGSNAILRFFGKYSYGLYVWHYLFIPVFSQWPGWFRSHIHPRVAADALCMIALLAVFTGMAFSSYWLFEFHFLKLKSRFKAVSTSTSALPAA